MLLSIDYVCDIRCNCSACIAAQASVCESVWQHGAIIACLRPWIREPAGAHVDFDDAALLTFLKREQSVDTGELLRLVNVLRKTDCENTALRAVEDLYDVLLIKCLLLPTDIPQETRDWMQRRKTLRQLLNTCFTGHMSGPPAQSG